MTALFPDAECSEDSECGRFCETSLMKQNGARRGTCVLWGLDWLSRCIANSGNSDVAMYLHFMNHAPCRCHFNDHHHEYREGADTGDQCSFGPFCFQREYGELCFNATSGMCLGTCSAHCSDGRTFLWRALHCPPLGNHTSDLPSKFLLPSQGQQPQWHMVWLVFGKATQSKGLPVRTENASGPSWP